MQRVWTFCGVACLVIIGASARPAIAGTGGGTADSADTMKDSLATIVVTAEKRRENVQQVPVTLTVIPSAQLSRQGVASISDLARASASLEFTAASAAPGGGAFIRGIGTESVGGDTVQPSVTVVLDGVALGNTNVSDIFDVNRVEVLEGPQGTLFGSSASAGVISITTMAPDPTKLSAEVNAEYGGSDFGSDYSRRVVRGVANLPLSDTSAVRLALHSDVNSGVLFNPYEGVSSEQPDTGVRARYLNKITDDLTLNLIADYNRSTATGVPVLTYRSAPAGSALASALADCGVTPSTSNFTTCSEHQNFMAQTDRGLSAQLDWNVGANTVTSISAYRLGTSDSRGDIEAIPLAIMENRFALGNPCLFYNCVPIYAILPGGTNQVQEQARKQFSEELRIASPNNHQLEWVAGVYYQHYRMSDDEPGLLTANFGGGTFTADTSFTAGVRSSEYAAFGNLTYFIGPVTRVVAGLRYTHSAVDENKHDPANSHDNVTYSLGTSANKTTFRVGLQHDFGSQTMGYLTYSTGYKGPEISDALSPNPSPGQPWDGGMFVVRPETPTNYELGVKYSALENRLALDLSVFYENVKDYQGQYSFANNQGTITSVPANVPKVVTKGIELTVFGRPWTGMSLNASAIYDPATYPSHYLASDGSDLGGHQLNYAAKTKVTLSGEQDVPVSENYSLVIGADATYRSAVSMYLSAQPQFVQPSGTLYNARIGVRSAKNWSVYFFGRNLGDTHFPLQLYPTPFQPGGLWQVMDANARKLIGLQFDAKFE